MSDDEWIRNLRPPHIKRMLALHKREVAALEAEVERIRAEERERLAMLAVEHAKGYEELKRAAMQATVPDKTAVIAHGSAKMACAILAAAIRGDKT